MGPILFDRGKAAAHRPMTSYCKWPGRGLQRYGSEDEFSENVSERTRAAHDFAVSFKHATVETTKGSEAGPRTRSKGVFRIRFAQDDNKQITQ